jgi:hypothetical protein
MVTNVAELDVLLDVLLAPITAYPAPHYNSHLNHLLSMWLLRVRPIPILRYKVSLVSVGSA